ncbi:ATP-binding protein [Curtobacterium sp. MCLR17_058]|uniref:AlbA family DNA-binding domain-containing protein n=1 Tax=Curtobacterium sp. MCLR17_058 TaxID=2175635 RepID=UPI000DA75095|nr:ATP-binding protein [Curtobacterium sp. MCLR17_058]WIB42698.1 ATP-binding protein [Curtobacterium sp. MCLR17_058]
MSFTALHRTTGAAPGPITDELLNDAVAAGVRETRDLDWKSELPPRKNITQTDFPKDVAAMANSGGGVIVYGVREAQKAATERVHIVEFDEGYERALRSAAVTAISPPVFALGVHVLVGDGALAVVVEVPASVDGPHLIYRNDYFGAPVRNDADTVWMKEREVANAYRARFDEQRHAREALTNLYAQVSAGRAVVPHAWLYAVASPRVPSVASGTDRDDARDIFEEAFTLAQGWTNGIGVRPLTAVERYNLRPGLRSWVAPNRSQGAQAWKEAWASVYRSGAAGLACAVGGHRKSIDGHFEPTQVESTAIENAVADLLALVRVLAQRGSGSEYDVMVGIEWAGTGPLEILTRDGFGQTYDGVSTPVHRYVPVEVTIDAGADEDAFRRQMRDLALDCINQGGVSYLQAILGE